MTWPNQDGDNELSDFYDSNNIVLSDSNIARNPGVSPEMCALSFYIDAMVPKVDSLDQEHTGHMVFIPKLYTNSSEDSALIYATKTVSLAAFGKFGGDQGYNSAAAHQMYGKAIKTVHEELASPEKRMQNSTLMSVMIMVTAESLLASSIAPLEKWASHIMGLCSLLKLRGPDVVDDPVSARLFLVARSFLSKTSRQYGFPLDKFFLEPKPGWEESVSQTLGAAPFRLHQIAQAISPLRSRTLSVLLAHKLIPDQVSVWAMISELEEMEDAFASWRAALSEHNHYTVIHEPLLSPTPGLKKAPLAWMTTRHQYATARIGRMWNDYRCQRIFVNSLMIRCLKSLDPGADHSKNIKIALHTQILQDLVDDICATIPIRARPKIPNEAGSMNPNTKTDSSKDPVEDAATVFWILWPLFVARGVSCQPEMQQNWLKGCMLRIAEEYQVRQALTMLVLAARQPERPLDVEIWDERAVENVWERAYCFGYSAM